MRNDRDCVVVTKGNSLVLVSRNAPASLLVFRVPEGTDGLAVRAVCVTCMCVRPGRGGGAGGMESRSDRVVVDTNKIWGRRILLSEDRSPFYGTVNVAR